jgi:hypothetical protein
VAGRDSAVWTVKRLVFHGRQPQYLLMTLGIAPTLLLGSTDLCGQDASRAVCTPLFCKSWFCLRIMALPILSLALVALLSLGICTTR